MDWNNIASFMKKNGYSMTKTEGGLECWYKPGYQPTQKDLRQADIEADFISSYKDECGLD